MPLGILQLIAPEKIQKSEKGLPEKDKRHKSFTTVVTI
jgi:hypothetical protein